MMKQVLDRLGAQEYVTADNVEAIRRYIRFKYSGGSKEELSGVRQQLY